MLTIASVRAFRDPAVRRAGGAVVSIRRSVQRRIPEHPCRNTQNVRHSPHGVRAPARIAGGMMERLAALGLTAGHAEAASVDPETSRGPRSGA